MTQETVERASQKTLLENENVSTATENGLAVIQTTPTSILQLAVERGSGAAELEKIANLIRDQEKWDAEKAFNAAMCACQAELPAVVRDAENKQTNSLYAKLETIGAAIDPYITKHGFGPMFGTADCPTPGWVRITCDLTHSGGHSKFFLLDLPPDDKGIAGKVNKTPIHGIASTLTYGERYLTCMMFKVRLANLDNDGNGYSNGRSDCIDPEQIKRINDLICEYAEALSKTTAEVLAAFLKQHALQSLDQMAATQFNNAVTQLDRVIRAAVKGK